MARRKKQNDEEPQENQDNLNNEADDTFGLPEVQYEPIRREEDTPVAADETTPETSGPVKEQEPVFEKMDEVGDEVIETYDEQREYEHREDVHEDSYSPAFREEPAPIWPKVLGLIALLLVVGAAIYYFAVYRPEQNRQKAELAAREASIRAEREEAQRKERERLEQLEREAAQRRADSLASIPTVGSLERLTSRTGQYYVVLASAIDDDLLTDFAGKLVKEGKQVRLIPPYGKVKFHRLAIESRDTYEDAQAVADSMKGGDYGSELWVLRY